jgi:tripartite-type tricarboxylate transporter receptor subunit TctC
MRAAPDGYTLMQGYVATHGTNPATRKVPYDPIKDFTPIGMIGATPNVLIVNSQVPVKNMKEFIDYVRKNPGKLSYGTAGQGSLTHMTMELFKQETGLFILHVPYRGIAPAINDLLGGQTQTMFPGLAAALQYIHSGKVRALAVNAVNRSSELPDVLTMKEAGVAGVEAGTFTAMLAPAKTPKAIVTRLNEDMNKVMRTIAGRLSDREMQALAEYVSGLTGVR